MVLKGGTALNLFIFDLPRLSVDIDLNYTVDEDRDAMLANRRTIDQAIRAVCAREGHTVRRVSDEHACGKWSLRYDSAARNQGNLDIDVNFMFRVPLWSAQVRDSNPVGPW